MSWESWFHRLCSLTQKGCESSTDLRNLIEASKERDLKIFLREIFGSQYLATETKSEYKVMQSINNRQAHFKHLVPVKLTQID